MTRTDLLKGIDRWRYIPDGVADPAEKRVFITNADGGVTALAVANGESLWTSDSASRPLIALRGAILAAGAQHPFEVVYLDDRNGHRIDTAADPLPIPPSRAWSPIAVWREDERILVTWITIDGAIGTAAIDVASGRITATELPVAQATAPAKGDELKLFLSSGGVPATWRAGDRMAALAVDVSRGKERLRLVTWNEADGRAVKEKELIKPLPASGYLEHHRSPDVDHIFLMSCNDRDVGDEPPGSICEWLIFRVNDGKQIAAFPPPPDLKLPMAVIANRVFYTEGGFIPHKRAAPLRRLCALDLATGKLAWSHYIGTSGVMA